MEKNMSKFDKDFIENYDENSNIGCIFEVHAEYPKDLHDLHSDLPFLPKRMKINKCNKPLCNLYNKKIRYSHKSLNTSIRSWISFQKSAQSN